MSNKNDIHSRNKTILDDYLNRVSLTEIAQKNALSVTRVSQLVKHYRQHFMVYKRELREPISYNLLKIQFMPTALIAEFRTFVQHFNGPRFTPDHNVGVPEGKEALEPLYSKPIDLPIIEACLLPKTIRALQGNGFTNMSQVAQMTPIKLFTLPYIGKKNYSELLRFFRTYNSDKTHEKALT